MAKKPVLAKPVTEANIAIALFKEAVRRGLCGDAWATAWWWQDQQRAIDSYRILGLQPDAWRCDIPGGGVAWVVAPWSDAESETRALRVLSVCSSEGAGTALDAPTMHLRNLALFNPHQWVTWREAARLAKNARADIKVGQWVGGADIGVAVLGMVVDLRPDGMPNRLQVGETIIQAPLDIRRWFVWGGEARQKAAARLADGGRHRYASYMGMLSAVTAKARRLIQQGSAPQDETWPLKLGWKRRDRTVR